MTNSSVIEALTEQVFHERVLWSELPVLVAVCASPKFSKLLERWAPQARSHLRIFQLSAEGSLGLGECFGVRLDPGLALFSQGAMCYQFIGDASQRELDELLARAGTLKMSSKNEGLGDKIEPSSGGGPAVQ